MLGRATCRPASFRSPAAVRHGNAPAPPCGTPRHGAIHPMTQGPGSTALSEPAPRTWPETRPRPRAGRGAPRDRPEAPPVRAGPPGSEMPPSRALSQSNPATRYRSQQFPCIVILLINRRQPVCQRAFERCILLCTGAELWIQLSKKFTAETVCLFPDRVLHGKRTPATGQQCGRSRRLGLKTGRCNGTGNRRAGLTSSVFARTDGHLCLTRSRKAHADGGRFRVYERPQSSCSSGVPPAAARATA